MKSRRSQWAAVAAHSIVGVLTASSVHAAPATSEELNGPAEQSTATASTPGQTPAPVALQPAGTGIRQSTTVELLLQLQDQPQVLNNEKSKNGSEPRRSGTSQNTEANKPDAAATPADANPLLNLKEMILGPARPRSADHDSRESTEDAVQAQRTPGSDQSIRAASRADSAESRESLLSNPVVRFIRQNRGLTISASILMLVAIWLTANFSLRRRR